MKKFRELVTRMQSFQKKKNHRYQILSKKDSTDCLKDSTKNLKDTVKDSGSTSVGINSKIKNRKDSMQVFMNGIVDDEQIGKSPSIGQYSLEKRRNGRTSSQLEEEFKRLHFITLQGMLEHFNIL